ncbi:hypothetical protein ABZ646_34560 [Streptomyces sp. NPDC007162]|uniref:hypothetical protein n=1 Tax=Streptomyces sp. NPDC007162 TaxID=3156917 RepID=UPI0033C0DFF5
MIASTRMSPPAESGLSHWSTRTLADHLKRREGVSWHYIARIWREENLKPHRSGTFKISKDPAFTEKVADAVGLYLAPPGGAVVLSIDEKTQVQALDRGHSQCCRWLRGRREAHPRLCAARRHQPVRRAECHDR